MPSHSPCCSRWSARSGCQPRRSASDTGRSWARITDLHSAQEVSVIALQCPDSGLLHVQSEHVLVAVLDEGGQPCREGEIGQVVVTDLHNFAMLLIRYALRDWANVGPCCSCGRGLPTLRRVMGRSRNMAISLEDKPFWPVLETRWLLEAILHLRQLPVRADRI